jgi:hypothetical protein
VHYAILGRSAHTTMHTKLLHCFCVQEHNQLPRKRQPDKISFVTLRMKMDLAVCNITANFRAIEEVGCASKNQKSSNQVSLTGKFPIHPDSVHTWGKCFQNVINKDKKLPAKGTKPGKSSKYKANLMDMSQQRSLLTILPCFKSQQSMKANALEPSSMPMLDPFNKTLDVQAIDG